MLDLLSRMSALELTVWGLFMGVFLGVLGNYYQRVLIGSFVRNLLARKAIGPDHAVSLAEARHRYNFPVISQLKNPHSALRKSVFELSDEIHEAGDGISHPYITRNTPLDLKTARFYIHDENRIRAEMRFSGKSSDIVGVIIAFVLFLAFAYGALLFVPFAIRFAASFFTKMRS